MARRSRWHRITAAAAAAVALLAANEAGSTELTSPPGRVHLSNGRHRLHLRLVVDRAAKRLAKPACAAVINEFKNTSGEPLGARLEIWGGDPAAAFASQFYRDGEFHQTCARRPVLAFTTPGNPNIYVCSERFFQASLADPWYAEIVLIHEFLHTLGLGENPPTSRAITEAVRRHCAG